MSSSNKSSTRIVSMILRLSLGRILFIDHPLASKVSEKIHAITRATPHSVPTTPSLGLQAFHRISQRRLHRLETHRQHRNADRQQSRQHKDIPANRDPVRKTP